MCAGNCSPWQQHVVLLRLHNMKDLESVLEWLYRALNVSTSLEEAMQDEGV